jgi:hypothetical protein
MTDSVWVPIRNEIEDDFMIASKYVFPALAVAAQVFGLPSWIGVVAGKVVPAAMTMAEEAFPANGSGPAKKSAVMTFSDGVLALAAQTFTGGALANLDKIMPFLSSAIDSTVALVNAKAPSIIANDDPGAVPPPDADAASGEAG